MKQGEKGWGPGRQQRQLTSVGFFSQSACSIREKESKEGRLMTKKWQFVALFAVLLAAMLGCEPNRAVGEQAGLPGDPIPYQPEVVAENLNVPWALAFAPDGRMFFTERPGNVRVIEQGRLLPQPVISFPAPFVSEGEGGLLGIAVDPGFAENRYLYVYHSYRERENIYNRVLRLRVQDNRAAIDKVLLDRIPGSVIHNGGRLKIGPDRKLYVTTGDARNPQLAQDLSSLAGKILRMNTDGTIPADNPFANSLVYSWGHRNPQGLAWSPLTGSLYSSEHGASAHDEVNVIEAGANYGWPVIAGSAQRAGMRTPLLQSGEETWAPAGMAFVLLGPWKNQLLVTNLRGEQIVKVAFDPENESVRGTDLLFRGRFGRLRDIVEGPDGSLYLLTSNRDGRGDERQGDDKIIRLRLKE
jgi:glucose/arabinose dehydrogenase